SPDSSGVKTPTFMHSSKLALERFQTMRRAGATAIFGGVASSVTASYGIGNKNTRRVRICVF
ncbi:MAG TPA: hypothetical protein VHC39_19850, partial [Rhizomicrobium sp.]|nr:hypothetical protein [Rhizomicrobium sp.]